MRSATVEAIRGGVKSSLSEAGRGGSKKGESAKIIPVRDCLGRFKKDDLYTAQSVTEGQVED